MSLLSKRAALKGRSARANRLRGAVSVLAFAAASFGLAAAGSAQAACTGSAVTINGPASGAYSGPNFNVDTGSNSFGAYSTCPTSITIASGTAEIVSGYAGYLGTVTNAGIVPIFNFSGALDTTGDSPQGGAIVGQINVAQGATLVLGGQQSIYFGTYAPFNNLLNDAGNLVVEGSGGFAGNSNQFALIGTNTVQGDLTLEAGANLRIGEYYNAPATAAFGSYTAGGEYAASTINFGPNTNVSLHGASGAGNDTLLFLNLNAPAVIGGALSADAYSEVWMHAGTLEVNGANTTSNPFVGTLQLDPGTTFVVGADSSHASAVFGDPNHTDGSGLTLDIKRPQGGSPVTLKGYGTIYANVTNEGIVQPGGVKGAPGALTVSQYAQSASGILQIEVTPNGASQLHVLGNADINGTLALTIDPGKYGNAIMPIVTTGGTLTLDKGFVITTQGSSAAGLAITSNSIDVVTELTSSLQVYGHLVQADRSHIGAFNDMLYDAQTDAVSGRGGAPRTDYGNGLTVWVEPFGRTSTISHAGYGYDDNAAGVTGGLEHRWANNALVGVAASYAGGQLTTDGGQTSANTNAYDVAIYGGFNAPNARLEGTIFYNGYSADVSRHLGSSGTISSSPSAKTFGASVQISHGIYNNVFVPYLRMTYANIDQSALTEGGGNLLALNVGKVQEGYFNSEVGFKIHPDGAVKLPWGLHSEITLAAVHDFSQTAGENVTGTFANLTSSQFNFSWPGDQGTAGLVGLNLSSDVTSHVQVFGKVDGEFSTYGRMGEIRLGGSYRF